MTRGPRQLMIRGSSFSPLVFTDLFLEYSPGLVTGFLFGLAAALAVQRLREAQQLTWKLA